MPANLPPEAKAKLAKYTEARTPEEKLRALEEFISAVPKHKGTENLLLWARRRMAELREEIEAKKRKRVGGGVRFFVEKSGAAQVIIVGPPNSGKSSLFSLLTGAKATIAPYPFSTKLPQPGMLNYLDIQFQLVDTPPILLNQPDSPVNSRVLGLARNADALMIVVSADENDVVLTISKMIDFLEERGIVVSRAKGTVKVIKTRDGGIRLKGNGRLISATEDDLRKLLGSYRIYNAIVEINGDVTLEDVEAAIFKARTYKPALLVVNKIDIAKESLINEIRRRFSKELPTIFTSVTERVGLEEIGKTIFKILNIIRIYTKQPNKEPDRRPLVLPRGSTVLDVAERIHSRLVKGFRYARIWGPSAKYPGERVGGDHILEDGDIVEIHAY
jgi:ribosome-interacting GTPase 1